MKGVALVLLMSAGGVLSPVIAAAAAQPPMGQFDGAYYTCDDGQAFQIAYDSKTPKAATLTTSNNNARYALKRQAGEAAAFSNGPVSVSLTDETATVAGTQLKLTGCKLKTTT
jgi:hypothetical protein